jgi:hypothetical protein
LIVATRIGTPLASDIRPEDQVILGCARSSVDQETLDQLRSLTQQDLDWTYLIRTAYRHGVMPLLYQNISTHSLSAVPESARERLQQLFYANLQHNLFLAGALIQFQRLFRENGIRSVPFKGAVLAASAYGDLALRQFSDLDILVGRSDVLRAKILLTVAGNRLEPQGYQIELSDWLEQRYLDTQCNYNFQSADGRVLMELHWSFAPRYFAFPVNIDRLWARLEQVEVAGSVVPNIPAEELLLILCSHGARHCWQRMAWICDIAELLRRNLGLDWDQVMRDARRLGSERVLLLGLRLSQDLVGAQLTSGIVQRILAERAVPALVDQVRRHLFDAPDDSEDEARFQVFHLRARERLRDKIYYSLGWALTPTVREWELLSLPASLSFLYYLFRPLRLIGNYSAKMIASSKAHLRLRHHM